MLSDGLHAQSVQEKAGQGIDESKAGESVWSTGKSFVVWCTTGDDH